MCHGEKVQPVLTQAAWILSGDHHQSPQAPLARFVSQSQLSLPLRHIEADVQDLDNHQVKQSGRDNAAVPYTGEAKSCAVNIHYNITLMTWVF